MKRTLHEKAGDAEVRRREWKTAAERHYRSEDLVPIKRNKNPAQRCASCCFEAIEKRKLAHVLLFCGIALTVKFASDDSVVFHPLLLCYFRSKKQAYLMQSGAHRNTVLLRKQRKMLRSSGF